MASEASESLESLLNSVESEIDESLGTILDSTDDVLDVTGSTIETASEAAGAANRRQVGKDRGKISLIIISTYTIAVLTMFWYILFTVPNCAGLAKEACVAVTGAWDKQAELLLNSITVAVLPIVTLMLGFYFGTAVSGSEGQKENVSE